MRKIKKHKLRLLCFVLFLPGFIQAENLLLRTKLEKEFDDSPSFTHLNSAPMLKLQANDDKMIWEKTEDFLLWKAVSKSKVFHPKIELNRPAEFYRLSRTGPRVPKLYVPNDYNFKKQYPFILLLHGRTGNSNLMDVFIPLKDLAEENDFIYCTPDGRLDDFGEQSWWGDEDSAYLKGLINSATEQYSIDKKRIYLIGHSIGAMFSYKMAHDHADIIAAIVAFSGTGFKDWPYEPEKPVSVLHIHGTHDPIIWWKGTQFFPSVMENFVKWREFNQCTKHVAVGNINVRDNLLGKETQVTRYENMKGTIVTELWRINFGGHIPSPNKSSRERIIQWLLKKTRE